MIDPKIINTRPGAAPRLARIIREILRPAPTCGEGVVSVLVDDNEVQLADRHERAVVAGNMLPDLGERVAWLRVDQQTVVVPYWTRPRQPQPMAGHVAPFWAGEVIPAVMPGQIIAANISPGCDGDRARRAWALELLEAEDSMAVRLRRCEIDDEPSQWAVAVAWIWPALEPWVTAGPTGATPLILIDASDRIFVWWMRGELWEHGGDAGEAWQALEGQINSDNGEATLGAPATIDAPAIQGFSPVQLVPYGALEVDEQGRLWAAALVEAWAMGCELDLLFGDELESGVYHYAIAPVSGAAELPPGPRGIWEWPMGPGPGILCGGPVGAGLLQGYEAAGSGWLPEGWHVFGQSFFQLDDPEAESTVRWSPYAIWLPAMSSARVTFGSMGVPNGGRRIYWAYSKLEYEYPWQWEYFEGGPNLAVEIPAPGAGEVVVSDIPGGPAPPETSTLYMQRVRVSHIRAGIPGTLARRIYRTQADGEAFGLVHELPGNTDDEIWDDATGPGKSVV